MLETEGIETYIHNVNQIQPVVSAGVRVRIKESDLPHALSIIEKSRWLEEAADEIPEKKSRSILIPVDFSDYSFKACEIGIHYAHHVGAPVHLMHAYFSPYFPSTIPLGETWVYHVNENDPVENLYKQAQMEMKQMTDYIQEQMDNGAWPKVPIETSLREGLPEEEILSYTKEIHPQLIVMGTRGKNEKDADLIGSVTGEVIEINRVPVLAIPEHIPFQDLAKAKHVAFATSFRQRDLVLFDQFMELIKGYSFHIHLFNISTSRNEWNEIRLTGVREYFKKQYPEADIDCTVLDDGDLLLAVEKFVRDKQIDMIAVSTYRRNLFARLFNPSIARKMLFHTDTPLLIMHA